MSKLGLAVIESKVFGRVMKCRVNLLTGVILDNPQNLSVEINDGKVLKVSLGDTVIDSFVVLKQYKVAPTPSTLPAKDDSVNVDSSTS